MTLLGLLDYAGVAVFAATGALSASRKQVDLVGFLFLASVTGMGGGTLRDIILARGPVFWVLNPTYVLVCVGIAILVFFTAHLFESRYRLLLWLDALGLAAYSVMGAAKGLAASGSITVAIVMGTMTATFGGVLRDLLAGEPSVLMRPEIYISCAMAGACVFTGAHYFGAPLFVSSGLGFLTAFGIRSGALMFHWTIPPYKARPGRRPEDVM